MEEVPYYIIGEDEESRLIGESGEAYIDDDDLKNLLIELLGDDVCDEEIQKILKAASDENLSEEDFDRLVDEFILKNRQ